MDTKKSLAYSGLSLMLCALVFWLCDVGDGLFCFVFGCAGFAIWASSLDLKTKNKDKSEQQK